MKKLILASALTLSSLALVGCAETGTRESTGQYIDNSVLTTKVKAALAEDSQVKSLPITVKSYKGDVQLSGYVNSQLQKQKAGVVAASVKGVKSVRNNLVVK